MPSLTTFVFIGFAFLIASIIVLSLIPLYIENKSVPKTRFILTTVRMNNYVLQMSRSLAKRDLVRFKSNMKEILTLDEAQSMMNSSIQYALEQQLKAGDNRDKFNIYILQMISYTENSNNMSVTLDFMIVYTRECKSCNIYRRSIIFKQLCSNNQLLTPIPFLIQSTNFSYTLSNPVIVYTPYIPIENIEIITRIVSSLQLDNPTNITNTNEPTQLSNQVLANNYTLTVTTAKSNYFATLDESNTQISASQNDGPVPLAGAVSMYPGLVRTIERQTQSSNGSNVLNIAINQIILQFWYSNSTIQVIVDFLINFSTSCDNNCMNQRSNQLINQLKNLTNTQINIQPANLTNGQVRILKGNTYVLYDYSLTTQVITNFTGTIIHAIPPTLTIVY
ncbi:unnamed protein product [Rotaria sp. Silwood1]|nr:unnamed protein product [Rotaria sp. Silwood1]CAF1297976.1 unnamed protein product [Rotaria sp. Silwood1]CAF3547097.1 unnamed protein product [Rotaria sp. Silwood1]CAF4702529.1 unnamed protein product [Rotaria sp. Silwood1]